eukprot:g31923.t1
MGEADWPEPEPSEEKPGAGDDVEPEDAEVPEAAAPPPAAAPVAAAAPSAARPNATEAAPRPTDAVADENEDDDGPVPGDAPDASPDAATADEAEEIQLTELEEDPQDRNPEALTAEVSIIEETRSRSESFSAYIATKELALQDMEAQVGEKMPPRIAGRILLKHANLSDQQRESLAIKHNALLTFDQVAQALRPLDRPEALVHKVAKNFVTATKEDQNEFEEIPTGEADEYDDEDLDEPPESDGEGNLTFLYYDPNAEYTEEEAQYIYAYNSAYKDVRRELQAHRKGRQFFKKGNSRKGKGVIKGKKGKSRPSQHGERGSVDDLKSRTRCFKCNQLGHMSRECPERNKQNFFVSTGPSLGSNRIYMTVRSDYQAIVDEHIQDYDIEPRVGIGLAPDATKKLAIYAGVVTEGYEAIVDTAAEEGVIGSKAMSRLRQCLSRFGLTPVPASGASVNCAGIGGSAKIGGIYDIPIGVAKTNGLLRVTEIIDEGSFETPFLLPISYQELVGAVINVDKNTFSLRNGHKTSMRRTPSGHRAIPILEMKSRISQWLTTADKEEVHKPKRMGHEKTLAAWKRMAMMIIRLIVQAVQQNAMEYLTERNAIIELKDEPAILEKDKKKPAKSEIAGKVRRGIGRPLPRSPRSARCSRPHGPSTRPTPQPSPRPTSDQEEPDLQGEPLTEEEATQQPEDDSKDEDPPAEDIPDPTNETEEEDFAKLFNFIDAEAASLALENAGPERFSQEALQAVLAEEVEGEEEESFEESSASDEKDEKDEKDREDWTGRIEVLEIAHWEDWSTRCLKDSEDEKEDSGGEEEEEHAEAEVPESLEEDVVVATECKLEKEWCEAFSKAGFSAADIAQLTHKDGEWFYKGKSTKVGMAPPCDPHKDICAGGKEGFGNPVQQAAALKEAIQKLGVEGIRG